MLIKTFQNTYDLAEFHCYFNNINEDTCTSVIELLLNTDCLDYIEDDLSNIFVVETDKHSYIFSGYKVNEYYITDDNDDLLKVICVK